MRRLVFVAVLCVFAGFLGCSKTQETAKPVPKKEVTAAKGTVEAKPVPQEAKPVVAAEEKPTEELERCPLRSFPNIHFAFDRYDLNDEAKRILAQIAEYMKECPDIVLTIEGHCDERGSNEYNLALGWKRANEAKRFLVSLGVDPNRIVTVSYGEERPLCFEHNESCWAKNRRDHFVFCRGECLR